MTLGNIKHRFAVQVHANNEESRLIGILKVAELFEHAGVHLSVDLSPSTNALIDRAVARPNPNPAGNSELLAVVVETLSPMTPAYPTGVSPVPPGMRYGDGMPPGGSPYFQSPPYPQGGWAPNQVPVFGAHTPIQRADASAPVTTESTPIFNPDAYGAVTEAGQAAMRAMEETMRGNIPGYEHNPMAQAEYIPQPQRQKPSAVGCKMEGSVVLGNWPDPTPGFLKPVTHITRLDDHGDGEPGFDYQIYGLGQAEGWKKLQTVSIMSHCDVEQGPNNPRIEDYLTICAAHLESCIRADQTFSTNHTNRTHGEALSSIRRALSLLNGNTVRQHLGTQAPKDAAPDAESAAS